MLTAFFFLDQLDFGMTTGSGWVLILLCPLGGVPE